MLHKIHYFMAKSVQRTYNETFKLEVLRDHYSSVSSIKFTVRKWGLSCSGVLHYWMKSYPVDSESLSLDTQTILRYQMKDRKKSKEEILQDQVLGLRKALEMEKLRSRAFEKLIEITEKEEGISILKKGGVKQ